MIKKIDRNHVHRYVCLADDAIDKEKSDLVKYSETFDIKHLVFHADKKPSFFLLKNLTSDQYSRMISDFMRFDLNTSTLVAKENGDIMGMSFKAFEMGCAGLEEDGKVSPIEYKDLSMGIVQEVSNTIMALAQLTEIEKK